MTMMHLPQWKGRGLGKTMTIIDWQKVQQSQSPCCIAASQERSLNNYKQECCRITPKKQKLTLNIESLRNVSRPFQTSGLEELLLFTESGNALPHSYRDDFGTLCNVLSTERYSNTSGLLETSCITKTVVTVIVTSLEVTVILLNAN